MKSLLVTVLFLVICSVQARADEFNTRLLLHSHKTVAESEWGMAGWVIAPNVSSSPTMWLSVAGPCYNGTGWNAELMAGAVVDGGDGKFLVDARIELTPELWGTPLYNWWNLQWINTGDTGTAYLYTQIDYVLPSGIGMVGAETENLFNADSGDFSLAPHFVLPLGDRVALVAAPQLHFDNDGDFTDFQFWTRAVINL